MEINLIVAIGKDGAIGKKGDLIWKISSDLKRFKALTTGHPVIMGRKTWESLPKKPLPGRQNIIISRNKDFQAEDAEVAASIPDALKACGDVSPFIIGGGEIYKTFLPVVTHLYLTEIDEECPEADTFLNLNLQKDWKPIEEEEWQTTPEGVRFRYVTYKKQERLENHHNQ